MDCWLEPEKIQKCQQFIQGETARNGIWGPAAAQVPGHENLKLIPWEHGSVLGLPVDFPSSTEFSADTWSEVTEKIEQMADVVTQLTDPQLAHHLL